MPDRDREAEEGLEEAVERRGLAEVGAADDVGDALVGVVEDDGEVVGGADVAAGEDGVAGGIGGVRAGGGGAGFGPGQGRSGGQGLGEVEADGVAGPASDMGRGRQVPGYVGWGAFSCGAERAARMSARVQRQG